MRRFPQNLKILIMCKDKSVEVTQKLGEKRLLTISRVQDAGKSKTVRYKIKLYSEVTKTDFELPYLTKDELNEILRRVNETDKFVNE